MPATPSVVRPPKSKFIFRSVVAVLVLLLIVFLGFDYWFYHAVQKSLPQRDGAVKLSGLSAPVIITYDSLGVPNIAASNLPDLFFAQGFITAQDRLWQMDMVRRYASGDLAVILGPKYLQYDREQRILGLRQVAERAAVSMDSQQRAQFESYAAGVNAYIDEHRKSLPLEFRFLGYFPHAWAVEDSLLVGLSMTEFLNHSLYKDKLEKEKVLAKLGPELTADLFVNTSWRDHPPGADGSPIELENPQGTTPDEEEEQPKGGGHRSAVPDRLQHLARSDEPQIPRLRRPTAAASARDDNDDSRLGFQGERMSPGSNNWVVSGAHTASGKPLLSNDMHLELKI